MTSFPPSLARMNAGRRMENYDRLCVESWIACGFRVLGVNAPDEIPALAKRYAGVEFIAVERNAKALFARNTPFIADIMSVLAAQPEPVLGLINSDLLFEPVGAWQNLVPLVEQKTVVTGQRLDARTLAGGALHQYFPGFDYFFFDREAAEILSKSMQPFSMGLPWWDYWCPLSLALRGFGLQSIARPAVLHLAHESRTDAHKRAWRRLGAEFARAIERESKLADSMPADWQDLIALCNEIDSAPQEQIESGACDARIDRLPALAVPIIAAHIVKLEDTSPSLRRDIAARFPFFTDLEDRIGAGRALHQAIWEEQQGRAQFAQTLYDTAMQMAPQDPGVLSACGNFFFRRGDMERAVNLLNRAAEYAPDSAVLLNSLGSALGQIGRDGEAFACFERAVKADPLDGTSYYNLALALYPQNRQEEVATRLEEMLREAPHFPDGALWLRRIRENFR